MDDNAIRQETFKEVVDHTPRLLKDNTIILPGFVEALGQLDLPKAIGVEKLIRYQSEMYQKFLDDSKLTAPPREAIGFIVPLTSYVPLPENYNASMGYKGPDKRLDSINFVSIASIPLTLGSGSSKVKWRLSVAFVGLADHESTYKNITKLLRLKKLGLPNLYERALNAINSVVLAYKLTPMRHNHDLHAVNLLDRPSSIYTVAYNVFTGDTGDIKEITRISMHDNLRLSTTHARDMKQNELESFRQLHVDINTKLPLEAMVVSKIYQAIDARCTGNTAYSIILADTFVEHAMSFMLYMMLIPKIGDTAASKKLDTIKTADALKNEVAAQIHMDSKIFEKETGYRDWLRECHKLRNPLMHLFIEQNPSQAQSQIAIDTSITFIDNLASKIMALYSDGEQSLKFFQLVGWYKALRLHSH